MVPWLVALLLTAAAPPRAAGDSITIARLQYDGGGNWYVGPSSLPNLLAAIRDRTGIPVSAQEATVTPLDPKLSDQPFLYLSGNGTVRFTPAERAALRAHLLAGGFLFANDSYGLDESLRAELALMFPDAPLTELPPDHPVFHMLYDFPGGMPKIHEHDNKRPQAFGIFHDGRLIVFYDYESDLGDGWENPEVHHDPPAKREEALRMGVNVFLYALSETVR